jgi:multidrug resistance efflux pump
MSQPFAHTLQSVGDDGVRGWLLKCACALALVAVWTAWFLLSSVPLYVATDAAQLEVDQTAYPLQSPIDGRIVRTALVLGADVHKGDVLVDLDSDAERYQLETERRRLDALGPQIAKINDELAVLMTGQRLSGAESQTALDEARARADEAQAAVRLAGEELTRAEKLYTQGLLSQIDLLRTRSERERRVAAAMGLAVTLDRVRAGHLVSDTDQQGRAERLRRDLLSVQSQVQTEKAVIQRLEHDVQERRILAPIDGRIGETARPHSGEFIKAGDRLATIVPSGELRAVSFFDASSAVGRIRRGQTARLRLKGFPSIQYGSIRATVAIVGEEAHDRTIRVELNLEPHGQSPVSFQHGMPATAEIEVDRVSPAQLVFRSTGYWLMSNSRGRSAQ